MPELQRVWGFTVPLVLLLPMLLSRWLSFQPEYWVFEFIKWATLLYFLLPLLVFSKHFRFNLIFSLLHLILRKHFWTLLGVYLKFQQIVSDFIVHLSFNPLKLHFLPLAFEVFVCMYQSPVLFVHIYFYTR